MGRSATARQSRRRLLETWPAGGPKVLWRRDVGSGFAGVAVVGDACILFHRVGDEAIAQRLNCGNRAARVDEEIPHALRQLDFLR